MTSPAMQFAIEKHGDQMYGDVPYRNHLYAVVQCLRDFGFIGKYADFGALHDTIEDTPATREEIEHLFGHEVSMMVWACTGVGRNREIRNATIYAKISMLPKAAIIKTADRICNVENAKPGSKHAKMYLGEREEFFAHVAYYAPRAMQDRLERAYAALEEAA